MRYFPFLRSKQNEMLALRALASDIAEGGHLIPIFEPVNSNQVTKNSIRHFIEESMPFLLICNPIHGNFNDSTKELADNIVNPLHLKDCNNWTPSLYVHRTTRPQVIDSFLRVYKRHQLALIYYGKPQSGAVQSRINAANIKHHVFMPNSVEESYIRSIQPGKRVIIKDPFRRRRNVEYANIREFFTELNTVAGNEDDLDFGDFSVAGDHYTEGGGAAKAVALHHIHFTTKNIHSLEISHFVSDRTETTADPAGKTIEAVNHLVRALDNLHPNDTQACDAYREMSKDEVFHGLGYMKRIAIMHHLEVILHSNGLAS